MHEKPTRGLRVTTVPSALDQTRILVEIAAFAIAAIWGVYVFTYQEILKPAAESPRMTNAVELTHARTRNGDEFVAVHVTYDNSGKVEIELASTGINLWGRRILPSDADAKSAGAAWEVDRSRALSPRRLLYSEGELRDAVIGGRRGAHLVLAPGAKITLDYTIVVPAKTYDIVDVGFQAWFLRSPYGTARIPLRRTSAKDGSSYVTSDGARDGVYNNIGELSFPL